MSVPIQKLFTKFPSLNQFTTEKRNEYLLLREVNGQDIGQRWGNYSINGPVGEIERNKFRSALIEADLTIKDITTIALTMEKLAHYAGNNTKMTYTRKEYTGQEN